MKMEMTPTMQLQEPDDTTVETEIQRLGFLGRCTHRPGAHCNRWKQIAERLYKELDAKEFMSDYTLPSYPGLDRLEQIHYTARSATELFMLSTMEKK